MTQPKTSMERAREIVEEYYNLPESDVDCVPKSLMQDIATELDKQAKLIEALKRECEMAYQCLYDCAGVKPLEHLHPESEYVQVRKERLELEDKSNATHED
jgi:hypothetical protein